MPKLDGPRMGRVDEVAAAVDDLRRRIVGDVRLSVQDASEDRDEVPSFVDKMRFQPGVATKQRSIVLTVWSACV